MAHDARHGLLTPSVRDGTAVLRGLALGVDLRLLGSQWTFLERPCPLGWACSSFGMWRPAGTVRDASVEWLLEDAFAKRERSGTRVVITDRGRAFLRAIDDSVLQFCRAMVKPLPIGELRAFIGDLRREHLDDDNFGLAQLAAVYMLDALFGGDWVLTHVTDGDVSPTNFFRNSSTDDHARTMGRLRLIQLAEMVFNLQHVPGLAKTLEMIETGDLEPGFAELEVGRMLHINGKTFEFIKPSGTKGTDYDLELSFDDVTVCGETKCKLETTSLSEKSLVDTLNYGRKQLPRDRPGVLFVKVPQTWYTTDDEFTRFLADATNRFFRSGAGRIVSVKFHSSLVIQTEVAHEPMMLLFEINNPHTRFDPSRDWRVFHVEGKPPDSWVIVMDECARGDDGASEQ